MKSVNQRRDEGAARNAAWQTLTSTEQLKALDKRLGAGKGATRQRAKLFACIVPVVSDTVTAAVEPDRKHNKKREK